MKTCDSHVLSVRRGTRADTARPSATRAPQRGELERSIARTLDTLCNLRSESLIWLWIATRWGFAGKSYAWRKGLCLGMIERLLREDRCRLDAVSPRLGPLPRGPDGSWSADVAEMMRTLGQSWTTHETAGEQGADPFRAEDYFRRAVPALVWPARSRRRRAPSGALRGRLERAVDNAMNDEPNGSSCDDQAHSRTH
jgi:hypothetical protein